MLRTIGIQMFQVRGISIHTAAIAQILFRGACMRADGQKDTLNGIHIIHIGQVAVIVTHGHVLTHLAYSPRPEELKYILDMIEPQ